MKHTKLPLGVRGNLSRKAKHYALVSPDDYEKITRYAWHRLYSGYVGHQTSKGEFVYLHRFIANPHDGMSVDHINGNKLDNRRENLRVCTHQTNMRNRPNPYANNTSGYRGVTYIKRTKKWRAFLSLGDFKTPQEAAKAAIRGRELLWGDDWINGKKTDEARSKRPNKR